MLSLGKELCYAFIIRFDDGKSDWIISHEDGIDWWPGDRRISIFFKESADPEVARQSCWLYFYTEVTDKASFSEAAVFEIKAEETAMSAPIILEGRKHLMLGFGIQVNAKEKHEIFGRLLSIAIMQYREADFFAEQLGLKKKRGYKPSAHRVNGPRKDHSAFATSFENVIGHGGPPAEDDNEVLMNHLREMKVRFENNDWTLFSGFINSGLVVGFPFGNENSVLTCEIGNHPLMGLGIKISHQFPIVGDGQDDPRPTQLSTFEVFKPDESPFSDNTPDFVAGSFSWDYEGLSMKPFLKWSCFIPKFMIKTQIDPDLKARLDSKLEDAIVSRALYLARYYTDVEMTKEAVASKRDQMKSMMPFLNDAAG
jgi:hypothetical protein